MRDRGAVDGMNIGISRKLVRVLALVCAVGLTGMTTASATTSRTAVGSRDTGFGRIIVAGSNHHTLYGFSKDGRNKSVKSACYGKCSKTWIPLWAEGQLVAVSGSHVNAKHLGKFRRKGGKWQVTYYGQPLYLYKRDTQPGQTNGLYKQEFGGVWKAIDVFGNGWVPM